MSHNGGEFKNELMDKIEEIYGIQRFFMTSFHPQGNGLVEHTNTKILEILHLLIQDKRENWKDFLPLVRASLNGSLNSSTTKTSYYMVFGNDLRLLYDVLTQANLQCG